MKRILILLLLGTTSVFGQNLTVIGIGKLGLSFALCLERAGYDVLGVDVSEDYVAQINAKALKSYEPKVEDYLRESRHFRATTSLKEGLEHSDLIFIVVATNSVPGIETYDHTILSNLLEEINAYGASHKHIVIGSTIFPGYIRDVAAGLLQDCTDTTLSYNPEFIAQGAIIDGLRNPDMVLIGEGSTEAGDRLEEIYRTLCENEPFIARMSPDSAEIAKLALNCYVTYKIAFANLVGEIADETPGADKFAILRAIGRDQRIGLKCLMPGYGFGGPCFPRDNQALGNYATMIAVEPYLFRATALANEQHADFMARKFLEMDLDAYEFEDVCYKSKCPVPIIECSQKLEVAKKIAETGKRVVIKDRALVLAQVKKQYGDLFEYLEE